MKKKSVLLQRDIEDQKEEMKHLLLKERELHDQIKILEKEVSGLSVGTVVSIVFSVAICVCVHNACRAHSMFV